MKTTLPIMLLLASAAVNCQTEHQTAPERASAAPSSESVAQPAPAPKPAEQIAATRVDVAGVAVCEPTSEVSSLAARAMDLADADGNGQVSREEAESMVNLVLGGAFFRADQNGDGKITPEEGRAARSALLKEYPAVADLLSRARASTGATPFKSLAQLVDANYGQTLTLTEARNTADTAVNDLFKLADTNKDGIISRDEALALANDGAEALGRSAFAAADENHDHFLSAAEFQDAVASSAKTVFAMFDSNKDGQLTEAEASAAMNAAGLRLGMPKLAQKD